MLWSKAIDCCSTGATVALFAVQYSDRLLLYRCYSVTVCCAEQPYIAFLPVLQWHCLLCSTEIDCCSTDATVTLSVVQWSDRLHFCRCYIGTVCCAVQRYIAFLPVLHWHCLLCSTAIDCCSTGATVTLSGVQYSDRLLFYRCYSDTVFCAVQR